MSSRPLIPESEKDKHKTRDQLLKELTELRGQLAAKTDGLAGCNRVVGMLDGITEPILILDDKTQIVYANSAAERLFAQSRELIEGRSLWDVYPKRSETLFKNAYEKARKTRSTGKFREQHRPLGKWFDIYLYPVPGGMTILFNDITASRQMEELPRLALTLLHNLKDNVFLMRADGRLFHVNNETKNSLGYSSDELHKMSILDLVPPGYHREWQDILDRIRQHGSMTFESQFRARGGREFPVEVFASHIELYGSSYYTVSARDITERRRADEALQKSQSELARAQQISHIGSWTWDLITDELTWSDESYRNYGLAPGEVKPTYELFLSFIVPEDRQRVDREVRKAIESGHRYQVIYKIISRDGKPRILLSENEVVTDGSGNIVLMYGTNQDITERKLAEEALTRAHVMLNTLLAQAFIGFAFLDRELRYVTINEKLAEINGVPVDAHIGKRIHDIVPSLVPTLQKVVDQILATGEPVKDHEFAGETASAPDVKRYWNESWYPMRDSSGAIEGFGVVIEEITERKRAEAMLQASEEKYRGLVEQVNDWVWEIDLNGIYTYASPHVRELLGYEPGDVVGTTPLDYMAPEEAGRVKAILDSLLREPREFSLLVNTIVNKEAGTIVVESSGVPVYDGQGDFSGYRGIDRDITERKRIEEALRESEESLSRAQQIAHIGSWEWDVIQDVDKWSKETYSIFGVEPGAFGNNYEAFIDRVHPEDRDRVREIEENAIRNYTPCSYDYRIVLPDGTIRYVHNVLEVMTDDCGNTIRLRGTVQDITERKKGEEALQVAKAQAELYLDLIGHDINNMNMIGMGYLEALLGHPGLDPYEREMLLKSLESMKGSSNLIGNVQKLQRASTEGISMNPINVIEVVNGVIGEFRQVTDKDMTINFSHTGESMVKANILLKDVFTNLIGNSIKHSFPGRHLRIGIFADNIAEHGKKFCRFAIEDDGPGIPDDVKARLFQRFVRGQTKARGSGLGLYLVKTLVEHYGGDIRIEDRVPGDYTKGAKFVVTIPSSE